MGQTDYEYRGMHAKYWDLLRGDTSRWDDRPFYKSIILESGQPALDVGCGTGRLLLDYLEQGIDIDGVDDSPEMLAICREKAQKLGLQPNVYQQKMQSLDLPRKYRTIIVPSSSFQLLTDPNDATEAMTRFYNHLEPGGTLVMPFMLIWEREDKDDEDPEGWKMTGERARPEDGALVRRWSRSVYDIPNQLQYGEGRYEIVRDGEVVESEQYPLSLETRSYTQEQAVKLYTEAGFTDVRTIKGFSPSHEPASAEDTLFTVLGRHKEA